MQTLPGLISSMPCCGPPRSSSTLSPFPASVPQILPAFSLQILPPSWTLQALVRFWPPCSVLVGEMQSLCCDKVNLTKTIQVLADSCFSGPACSDHGDGSSSQREARVWLSPPLEGRWQRQSGFCWSLISQLQTLRIPGFSQSLAVGTIFPMAEPAFGDAASTPV